MEAQRFTPVLPVTMSNFELKNDNRIFDGAVVRRETALIEARFHFEFDDKFNAFVFLAVTGNRATKGIGNNIISNIQPEPGAAMTAVRCKKWVKDAA